MNEYMKQALPRRQPVAGALFTRGVLAALLTAGALLLPAMASATEVAGVKVDDKVQLNGGDLLLNGAGLRSRLLFKVYVAALYVPRKTSNASDVFEAPTRRVSLRLLRDLDADTLSGALRDGLHDNLDESRFAALQTQFGQFDAIMRRVGNVRSGDVINLDFFADNVAVSCNGDSKGSVGGNGFAAALLRVWLGDKPVDGGLKKALLGG